MRPFTRFPVVVPAAMMRSHMSLLMASSAASALDCTWIGPPKGLYSDVFSYRT